MESVSSNYFFSFYKMLLKFLERRWFEGRDYLESYSIENDYLESYSIEKYQWSHLSVTHNIFKVNVTPHAEKEAREVCELFWQGRGSITEHRGELCLHVTALFASMTPVSHPESVIWIFR